MTGKPRARTQSVLRTAKVRLRMAGQDVPDDGEGSQRPRKRGECAGMARPCPFVSCRHHLALEVNPESGAIKIRFPLFDAAAGMWDVDWDAMKHTCSLDVAETGPRTLEAVGELLNVTRERVRQCETEILMHGREIVDEMGLKREDL